MNNPSSPIFIASSSLDEPSWKPVADNLSGRGYEVIVYEADRVADGAVPLEISVNREVGLSVCYAGQRFEPENIASAWCRRPTLFSGEQEDKARQLSLDAERKMIQYSLWDAIPSRVWLSDPQRISHAEHKLTQLALANRVGFDIPDTIITNNWEFINESLPRKIIFKPSYGMLYIENKLNILYTVQFDNNLSCLPTSGNPFPGLWQSYLPKSREWRITIVGDQSFDAAIYTDNAAKDDWRKHQLASKYVQFRKEIFPLSQKAKCFEYLDRLSLRFGAFDFIEGYDGSITFLECNANGQFGWLEDELGYPISNAIADELASIARNMTI